VAIYGKIERKSSPIKPKERKFSIGAQRYAAGTGKQKANVAGNSVNIGTFWGICTQTLVLKRLAGFDMGGVPNTARVVRKRLPCGKPLRGALYKYFTRFFHPFSTVGTKIILSVIHRYRRPDRTTLKALFSGRVSVMIPPWEGWA
jgi:hypothetical protein